MAALCRVAATPRFVAPRRVQIVEVRVIHESRVCLLPSAFRLLRQQPTQVGVAARTFDLQPQRPAFHPHLDTENRPESRLLRGLHEFHRAVQVALIAQTHGGQAVLLRQRHDGRR